MADVLLKIQRLLALSTSSNENEARTAAIAAAKLIREFGVILTLPGQALDPDAEPITPGIVRHPKGAKIKDRYGFSWTFFEEWGGGGNCTFCGLPCFRGNAAYRSEEEGGLIHLLCWTSRQTGKTKPGPAPAPRPPPKRDTVPEERKQKAMDDFWDHFEKTRGR